MTAHPIVSADAWLDARRDLLAAEKDLTRRSDQVADLRRRLPWVRVDTSYVFEGPGGPVTLADLFAGHRQLLIQHFMFGPGWEQGCPSCSFMADHADGMMVHLANRDLAFAAVSRAPIDQIERFRRRMGWQFSWVSSHANSFNHDFEVSFTPEAIAEGNVSYNFTKQAQIGQEMPGLSVFLKDEEGSIYRTYSTYGRGVEAMIGAYRLLDLTPMGRDEDGLDYTMQWVRHHDLYETARTAKAATCCGGQS
jgi:predicted dithiol-disulfide oxidoreductase (DUF899 family)